MFVQYKKQGSEIDSIILDLLAFKELICSIYLIGSRANNEWRDDSDIDVVVFVHETIRKTAVFELRQKYPYVDLIILRKDKVVNEIQDSPSYYIGPINQIILNKRLLYGEDVVEDITIMDKHINLNQLYFPWYSIKKVMLLNNMEVNDDNLFDLDVEKVMNMDLSKVFVFDDNPYYSYKDFNTLMLTLCSFLLIKNKKFKYTKPGKNWFVNEYLSAPLEDRHYPIIKGYNDYIREANSFVFSSKSTYIESTIFKESIARLILDYLNYIKHERKEIWQGKAYS